MDPAPLDGNVMPARGDDPPEPPAPLDGNVLGGLLHEVFGAEMTAAFGTCAHCGSRRQVAEFVVYLGGPGAVARCRDCLGLLMVITSRRSMNCVDLTGLSALA